MAVKSYQRPDDFWFKYSDPIGKDGMGLRKRWTWTKVLKALRVLRKGVDEFDAIRAQKKYDGTDIFATQFSYRKGARLIPFKKDAQIARKLRKLEGHPRFWDYEEEDGGDAQEEESDE